MFVIWYFLFSILYLLILTLNFLFCKVLKLNENLFNIFFFRIDYFFNFYNLISSAEDKNNSNLALKRNSIIFKNLYSEFTYFSNKSTKSTDLLLNKFESIVIFCSLNNSLFAKLADYSTDFNYLSYISLKNSKSNGNVKKSNLNFFFNRFLFINEASVNSLAKFKSSKDIYSNFKKKLIFKHKKLILVADALNTKITNSWVIKFSPSNFIKYINSLNLNKYNILYLRKAKVFNKGRYSRNRQYYRTGVYWCLYVNIIAVVGIYFWFYRFTMNFGYLWWLLYLFIASFIIPKAIKYRFYNIITLTNSISKDLLWISYITLNLSSKIITLLNLIKSYLNRYYLNFYYFSLVSKSFRTKNIVGYLNLLTNFFIVSKGFSIFNSSNSIHKWEFNNVNYYYNSVIKSRPVYIEKFKQFTLRLLCIVFLSR